MRGERAFWYYYVGLGKLRSGLLRSGKVRGANIFPVTNTLAYLSGVSLTEKKVLSYQRQGEWTHIRQVSDDALVGRTRNINNNFFSSEVNVIKILRSEFTNFIIC